MISSGFRLGTRNFFLDPKHGRILSIFRSLENGLLIQHGPDVAKHSVERWIKIAATMVYSIGKRMVN